MKKLMITLVLTIIISSMSISAWAAPAAQDTSCAGNAVTSKQNTTFSQTGSGCLSGTDANTLFDCIKSIRISNGTVNSSQSCNQSDTSKALAGAALSEDQLKSFGIDISEITGNTACPDSETACAAQDESQGSPTSEPADSAPAVSAETTQAAAVTQDSSNQSASDKTAVAQEIQEQTDTQTVAASAETAAAQDIQRITCNDNGCDSAASCTQTYCAETENQCDTENCTASGICSAAADTSTTSSSRTLYGILSALLEKCGINSDILSCFGFTETNSGSEGQAELPNDSGTGSTVPSGSDETTVPSGSDETTVPSGSDETTVPSDGNETTTPSGGEETAAGNIDNLSYEQQVAALVNEQREANGLQPLTLSGELSDVARIKSQDMHDNNYFSHTSPTYGSPFDMLNTFGITYRAAGENIAMGYATPEAVVNGWMNSPGHRANILNSAYTQIGVGYVADGSYWTQEFIG